MSSFYESSDFNSSSDVVSSQESSVDGISAKPSDSDDVKDEVKPVTDLEDQFAKDSLKDSPLVKHSADVLADAVRSVMDEDS